MPILKLLCRVQESSQHAAELTILSLANNYSTEQSLCFSTNAFQSQSFELNESRSPRSKKLLFTAAVTDPIRAFNFFESIVMPLLDALAITAKKQKILIAAIDDSKDLRCAAARIRRIEISVQNVQIYEALLQFYNNVFDTLASKEADKFKRLEGLFQMLSLSLESLFRRNLQQLHAEKVILQLLQPIIESSSFQDLCTQQKVISLQDIVERLQVPMASPDDDWQCSSTFRDFSA